MSENGKVLTIDPTRKDAGLPQPQALPPLTLAISYDVRTGQISVNGPADDLIYFGLLKLAELARSQREKSAGQPPPDGRIVKPF